MIREDYIIRMIRQVGQFLARMVSRRSSGQLEEALREGDGAYDLLGVPRELCDVLDTPTLAGLLRDPDKMRAMARLSWEESRIFAAKGDPLTSFSRMRRALELFLEARALSPTADDETSILELSRTVHASHLDARYQQP